MVIRKVVGFKYINNIMLNMTVNGNRISIAEQVNLQKQILLTMLDNLRMARNMEKEFITITRKRNSIMRFIQMVKFVSKSRLF